MANPWYVYILSNYARTVLYIGITNDLALRLRHHRTGKGSSFVPKHNLHYLVDFEKLQDKWRALAREKQLKSWHRNWKLALIRKNNPTMRNLSAEMPGALVAKHE